jgi:acyl carrier protein
MSLEERVRAIVAVVAKRAPEEIEVAADLRVSYGVDSLQGLLIIAHLEKTFEVTLDVHDLDTCRSVLDIVAVVAPLLAGEP